MILHLETSLAIESHLHLPALGAGLSGPPPISGAPWCGTGRLHPLALAKITGAGARCRPCFFGDFPHARLGIFKLLPNAVLLRCGSFPIHREPRPHLPVGGRGGPLVDQNRKPSSLMGQTDRRRSIGSSRRSHLVASADLRKRGNPLEGHTSEKPGKLDGAQ